MQLETKRLLIRDLTVADFDAVYAYGSDPEVVRYMAFPLSTPESTREHIARCIELAQAQPRRWYDLGIALKSTGEIIGGIALDVFDREHGEAAFSYLLNRAAWGQGYATEALTEIVRFGFAVLGLQRIADTCDIENTASAHVMEKCGFQFEGQHDGERHYGLSAATWLAM